MPNDYLFAGHRIINFGFKSKELLKEVADRLMPYKDKILENWMKQQYQNWEPTGFTQEDIRSIFNRMIICILGCMNKQELELCMSEMESIGSELADSHFPFEALVISVHFLEKSYMPFLLNPPSPRMQQWLIAIDEFLHAILASVSTAYFNSYRRELLDRAEVGRIVQEGLLADIPRSAYDLEIAHIYTSSRERAKLGGDFLDFFTLGSAGAAFIIGDLSGHGLEAASDSLMLRSLFRGFMRENPSLTDAMSRLNRVLVSELQMDQFATALAVFYDSTGKLRLVNAGHPYPIICNNGECKTLRIDGPALSVDENAGFSISDFDFELGSVFVAYTDGLIEARPSSNLHDFFGEERVLEAIGELYGAQPRAIAEHLLDTALKHAGGKFADDVAILVLKRSQHSI